MISVLIKLKCVVFRLEPNLNKYEPMCHFLKLNYRLKYIFNLYKYQNI